MVNSSVSKKIDGVDAKELAHATFNALDCEMLCVTRGGDGAAMLTKSGVDGAPGVPGRRRGHRRRGGDRFLATLLDRLLEGMAPEVALERACRIGAFVATQQGATPRHDAEGSRPVSSASEPTLTARPQSRRRRVT